MAPPLVRSSFLGKALPLEVKLHPIIEVFSFMPPEIKRKQIAPPLAALFSSNMVFMISLFDLKIIKAPPHSLTQFLVKLELIILFPVL